MKKNIVLIFPFCLFFLISFSLSAREWKKEGTGFVTGLSNVCLEGGHFRMQAQGREFCRIGMETDSAYWNRSATKNYNQRMQIQFGAEKDGQVCLLLNMKPGVAGTDTAWQIETGRIPWRGRGTRFAVDICAAADFIIRQPEGTGYRNTISWYDADGALLLQRYLNLETVPGETFRTTRSCGPIPPRAASFQITLGFDKPNIPSGKFLAVSGISVSEWTDASPLVSTAMVEFEPQAVEDNRIFWEAEIPAGTSLAFQMAEAEDSRGCPGKWGGWHGPDGTEGTWYTMPFQTGMHWAKLRMRLAAAADRQPILKKLTVGGFCQTNWELLRDNNAPLVENLTHSPTENRREKIVLRITGASPVNWKSFYVQVDRRNVTAKFHRDGNVLTYEPEKDFADGLHKIELVVTDIHGNKAHSVKSLLIGKSPEGVPHAELRDDGILLVDGKAVFPIGVYNIWKREFNNFDFDRAFQDLKDAGFNFAHTYKTGPDYLPFLDVAKKYGFYVWTSYAHGTQEPETLRKFLWHPAIVAWYIGDDTSDNSTPCQVQDRHDAMRAIDAHRITVQADHVTSCREVSDYRHFVPSSSGFLPEIYPIHDISPEDRAKSVAEVIQDMRVIRRDIEQNAIQHSPCIWALLQHFQGWGGWNRFPDARECRAMAYAAIIYGATGITWYTYGGVADPKTGTANYGVTSTPERWKAITTVTRQLHELEPVLTERSPEKQPAAQILEGSAMDPAGNPAVSCLLKIHNGEKYLFAVNSTLSRIRARIPLAEIRQGEVLFEGRAATVENQTVLDVFAPYDVHVYHLK